MKNCKIVLSIVVVIVMCFSTCFTAYADGENYVPQQIEFIVDSARTIMDYDGTDEAYNAYLESTGTAAAVGLMVESLRRISNVGNIGNIQNLYAGSPIDFVCDNAYIGEEYLDGKFRGIVANRDFVDRLYSLCNNYGPSNRYASLDDYGIDIGNVSYQINTITTVGNVLTFKPDTPYNGFDGYYNLVSAIGYNGITFLSGGDTPPIMFVPRGIHIRQNGVDMVDSSRNMLYVLVGNNEMYGADVSPVTRNLAAIYLYTYSGYSNPSYLELCSGLSGNVIVDSNTGKYVFDSNRSRSAFALFHDGVKGSTVGAENCVSVFQLFAMLKGKLLIFSGDTVEPVEPPVNIPYDNDDYVIIYYDINEDNSVNYNGGIHYMPVNDFSTNYDNDKITYDYSDHFSTDQTVNNVINNYNYITENGGFDDISILDRLDTIISKLQRIINDNNAFRNDVMSAIMSNQPIYTNYMDCLADNLPILQTVDSIKNQNVGSDSGISELNSWLSGSLPVPSGSGESYGDGNTQNTNGFPVVFHNFPIDLSWYEPYRLRVRSILCLPVWGLAIAACWACIKSVFGVHSVGGG